MILGVIADFFLILLWIRSMGIEHNLCDVFPFTTEKPTVLS